MKPSGLLQYARTAVTWTVPSAVAATAGQSCNASTAGAGCSLSTRTRMRPGLPRRSLPNKSLPGDQCFSFHRRSFTRLDEVIDQAGLRGLVDGLLFDLGVSSPQLDDAARGFSFLRDGMLDMRMNPGAGFSAADWVNQADQSEIRKVLRDYGEERYAGRIARAITERRSERAITTTRELAELVRAAVPRVERNKHPATRSFLAIRIHVNNELEELRTALSQVTGVLRPGGRLAVISFHSGEDRIVKRFIRQQSRADPYPGYLPVTEDQIKPAMRPLGRPLKSGSEAGRDNPRGRSAILRVAEKLQ